MYSPCFVLLFCQLFRQVISLKEFSLAQYSDIAVYPNNSFIDINLVGGTHYNQQNLTINGGALECHTDNLNCCNGTDQGEWLYSSNKSMVPAFNDEIKKAFYVTRGHMVIRLNRVSRSMSAFTAEEKYACIIPDAGGVNITRNITLGQGISCPQLNISNGTVSYTPPVQTENSQLYAGTIAIYSCSPGYRLIMKNGSSQRACQKNGSWNGTEPSCARVESELGSGMTTTDILLPFNSSVIPTEENTSQSLTEATEAQTTTTTNLSAATSKVVPTEQDNTTAITEQENAVGSSERENIAVSPTKNERENIVDGESMVIIVSASAAVLFLTAVIVVIFVCLALVRRKRVKKQRKRFFPEQINMEQRLDQSAENSILDCKSTISIPPTILEFPSHRSPTEGEGVHIEVKVEGHPPPTLVWYHNGKAVVTDYSIEIDEQGSLFFPTIELRHSGVYKVVVTNKCGEAEKEFNINVMSEGCDGVVGDSETEVTSRPVTVTEFGKFVSEYHTQGNKMFRENYERLSKGEAGHEITVSIIPENKIKNRFKNINVYDDNRITLQPLITGEEKNEDEYINASYIDGYSVPKKFIAAQGPMKNTVVDFWRMVCQERASTIVMLTNCVEGGRNKCEQYWPESGNEKYGPFQVTITDKHILADYTIRKFVVSNTAVEGGISYSLTQFHFTAWPDHGVPAYVSPVLSFHQQVKSHHVPSSGPLIIHCSAGVGRTGTYITLDNVFDQVEAESLVDIDGVIVKARNQRMKMVQTKEQYVFIHDAVLEFLTCGDTQTSPTNFKLAINKLCKQDPTHQCTGYQHQFNILAQVSPSPSEIFCAAALKHPDKNRGNKYLPVETSRVILRGEQPDYINAVTTNGYKLQKAYIIAQNPLDTTVRNFWKMITDRKCGAVVMLSDSEKNEELELCAQYWPSENSSSYGEFTVSLVEQEKVAGLIRRKLIVESSKLSQGHQVTQFQVTNWSSNGTCSNLKVITDVIEEVAKVQRRSGNNPLVVHCSDTVSRSGMFCAIATTIDRCKTEGVVDVFQVVKALRIHKPGAVLTVEQYILIHEAILVFLNSFDTYANFA